MNVSLYVLIFVVMLTPSCAFAVDVPAYGVNSWWEYTQDNRMSGPSLGDGGYLEWTNDMQYVCTAIGPQTQSKTGDSYDVYKLEGSGTLNMSGYAYEPDYGLMVPIQMLNGSISSEVWLRRSDLAVVKKSRTVSGNLEIEFFFNWIDYGTFNSDDNTEYQPPQNAYNFPLEPHTQWQQTTREYYYGSSQIASDPTEYFDSNEVVTYDMNCTITESQNGYSSLKILGWKVGGTMRSINWYSSDVMWDSKNSLEHADYGDLNIEYTYSDLIDFHLEPPPPTYTPTNTATATPSPIPTDTPTDTPVPTETPVPPTMTPTPNTTALPFNVTIGWNSFSFPLEPMTSYTALAVATELNNGGIQCSHVGRWSAGGWQIYQNGLPFNNFTLEMAEGYFIRSTSGGTWNITGYPVYDSYTLSLTIGWNSVGIPYSDVSYSASTLATAINNAGGDVSHVGAWSAGGWQIYQVGLPFNNFTIENDRMYFIRCLQGVVFKP